MSTFIIKQMIAIMLEAISNDDMSMLRNQIGALKIYQQAWNDDYIKVIEDLNNPETDDNHEED